MGVQQRGAISRLVSAVGEELASAIEPAAEVVQVAAQISITTGAVSGSGHIASAPGDPPNNDTGLLANSIVVHRTGKLSAQVVSEAPYSAKLEYGTSKMAERPYMRPAAIQSKDEIKDIFTAAVARGARRAARGMG